MNPNTLKQTRHPLNALDKHWKIDTIRDANNELSLRYGVYKKSEKKPKQYLVFLNGRSEFIEKYDYIPADLNLSDDWGFVTMDHRGQGLSGGARGHVDSYDLFANDTKRVLDKVVGDTPYYFVCHSMGGLIALYGQLNGYFKAEKLVLASPLFELPKKPLPHSIAKPLSSAISFFKAGPLHAHIGKHHKKTFAKNKLTHSYERYSYIQKSPYKIPSVTFGWIDATFNATDNIFTEKSLSKINADIYIMGSPGDRVVEPSAWKRWAQLAKANSKQEIKLELIQGGKHELYAEIPKYYDQAISFIKAALGLD